jgi:hypothetical protein
MTIEINKFERMYCTVVAVLRQWSNYSAGKKDRYENDGDRFLTMTIDGVIGEYAFCKWRNIFMDCSMEPRQGSYDFFWKGLRWDLKTNNTENGDLMIHLYDNPDVDIYALAILRKDSVYFPGYIMKKDIRKEENIFRTKNMNCYRVSQAKLTKWKHEETRES